MELLFFLKIFSYAIITSIIIAAIVWVTILVISTLDGINKRLGIIITILRTNYQIMKLVVELYSREMMEEKDNENNNE